MPFARLRFHGELLDLLPRARHAPELSARLADGASAKHVIEAMGVPHTEVGALRVDGRPATLDTPVADGATVDVEPVAPADPADAAREPPPRFIADAHLGGLARRLRLLGFDTVFAGTDTDEALAARADAEDRIVLSRDRELLKHRRVRTGRYVRAMRTDDQLDEVARRFALRTRIRPFTRCLECNGTLEAAQPDDVAARLPPGVLREHDAFTRCVGCGRVYWPGSHWRRLGAAVAAFLEPRAAPSDADG